MHRDPQFRHHHHHLQCRSQCVPPRHVTIVHLHAGTTRDVDDFSMTKSLFLRHRLPVKVECTRHQLLLIHALSGDHHAVSSAECDLFAHGPQCQYPRCARDDAFHPNRACASVSIMLQFRRQKRGNEENRVLLRGRAG